MWKYFFAFLALVTVTPAHAAQDAVTWTYDGTDDGQEEWGNLSPEFEKCGSGTAQSPVVISRAHIADLPKLEFGYRTSPATLSLDLYTIVTSSSAGLKLVMDGKETILRKMLMRSTSEHRVGDRYYPVELQLQHEDALGNLTSLSVFVTPGAPNAAIQSILDTLKSTHAPTATLNLDWNALLPESKGYYAYDGSLSYPPCTEGVKILVMKTPIEASMEQVKALAQKLGRSNRVPQPIYLRNISESED